MIEYRALLRKSKKFEGGFSLKSGCFIYVRETPHGWLGMYYTDKGSGHGFALDTDDFSIVQAGDCQVLELVSIPDPPEPPEKAREEAALARRRLENKANRHLEAAKEIHELLAREP